MARIGTFYGLCPLIDQKSLLGISEDVTPGYVIVTLGKNIAIKYKLSDQKQTHSWSSKERLTCGVIYDRLLEQYVAVFNNSSIRIFGTDCESLDKIKKHKFQVPIHSIITHANNLTIVIFKNGTISKLKYALEMRKQEPRASVLEPDEVIQDQICVPIEDYVFIGLSVKTRNGEFKFYCIPLHRTESIEDKKNIIAIKLTRKNSKATLSGHVLTQENSTPILLTLWSDGKLFSLILNNNCESPGTFISVVQSLCCTQQVAMIPLNLSYIAMYGANTNQEGSSLIIYNTHFQVTQCKQPFKLSSTCSKIWDTFSNLLFPVGNNLAVVPYKLATEQLAALVGSHVAIENNDNDSDVSIINKVEVVDWGYSLNNEMNVDNIVIPDNLQTRIKVLLDEGYSEMNMMKEILPSVIEKKDLVSIHYILDNYNNIPEQLIVKLLSFSINIEEFAFTTIERIDIEIDNIAKPLQPLERFNLVNKILCLPLSDVLIIPYLRTEVDFSENLILLQHICFLLSENESHLPNMTVIKSENKCLVWGSLLLDSHYQEFLLIKNKMIKDILKYFQNLVKDHMSSLHCYKKVVPYLEMIKKGKNITKKGKHSKWYSIEQLALY